MAKIFIVKFTQQSINAMTTLQIVKLFCVLIEPVTRHKLIVIIKAFSVNNSKSLSI